MASKRDITSFFKPNGPSKKAKSSSSENSLPAEEPSKETTASPAAQIVTTANPNLSFIPSLPESWQSVLGKEESKPYYRSLDNFLQKEVGSNKKIYPPKEEIFTALSMCPFDEVRVVIIGQDPYHGAGQGHGLAFSVKPGIAVPPSLRNIIKEATTSVGISKPTHGNLSKWAQQGVLLLNNVLTVEASKADSHKGAGWETFTDEVVRVLNKDRDNLVFMLWGKPSSLKGAKVDRKKHLVISSSHPSPLGATKTSAPFIGSNCFKLANEYLAKNGKATIDWSL
jgi:uracil-DNA glycosylase